MQPKLVLLACRTWKRKRPGELASSLGRVETEEIDRLAEQFFGTPGRPFSRGAYMGRNTLRVCVSREFTVFALHKSSPVVNWLRRLAAQAHAECGGPGVGAVGMCFTGGFALAMAVDERVLAPVLSQPALPAPLGARYRASIDISPADLLTVKARTQQDGLCVLGLRFTVWILVPGIAFGLFSALAVGISHRHDLGTIALAMVLIAVGLQLGYLAGTALHYVIDAARAARPRSALPMSRPAQ